MKNGGYGGLLVGNHYDLKQQLNVAEQEKEKYNKWLETYNRRMEDTRR